MNLLRLRRFARCPFWLLIAAWLCANTPQAASWHVLLWVKQAQHFSHQQNLRSEVAALMSGQPSNTDNSSRYVAQPASSKTSEIPMLPADFAVKKILLSMETASPATRPLVAPQRWREGGLRTVTDHVTDVPSPPPRA